MFLAQIQEDYAVGVATDAAIPALPPRGALIQVIGCGICGSDLDKVKNRKVPPGTVLGHEITGVIHALDDEYPGHWRLGDRIVASHHVPCLRCHYCLNDSESMCRQFKRTNFEPGGFSQYVALSELHLKHTTFKVPKSIDSAEASCVEPLACVLRAVRRTGYHVNGSIVIIGLGFIGQMAAQVYHNNGYAVFGVDLDVERVTLAKDNEFVTDAFAADSEGLTAALRKASPVEKADIVFLTVVNAHTLALALEQVRDGGHIILFTSGQPEMGIDPNVLYFREITVITSYSPALQDLKEAARMIFNHEVQTAPLISHRLPIAAIQEGFETYRQGRAIKVFITLGEAL